MEKAKQEIGVRPSGGISTQNASSSQKGDGEGAIGEEIAIMDERVMGYFRGRIEEPRGKAGEDCRRKRPKVEGGRKRQ